MTTQPTLKDRPLERREMAPGQARTLTYGEWAILSTGLAEALRWVDAAPVIINRATPGARIARLWRGATPIMAWGDRIYWPGALDDFSAPGTERQMAVLQHELQHVLEFASGELSILGYALNPRNWRYRYVLGPDSDWRKFGAEQRASIAEHLWLIERGLGLEQLADDHRRVIPWANPFTPS
jgi:hypothetical protein